MEEESEMTQPSALREILVEGFVPIRLHQNHGFWWKNQTS